MFGQFERAVAGRYLRARRGERFVSVIAGFSLIGIALGVATLIIVMSVMNGFKSDLLSRILGLNGDLGVFATNGSLTEFDQLATKVRDVPGVLSAVPVIEGQVLLNGPSGSSGGLVRGVRQADLEALPSIGGTIRAGSLGDFSGDDAIAIGLTLAQQFGLSIGSKLTLLSPDGAATAFGTVPRVRAYRVVAIFFAAVQVEQNVMFLILTLIIVVAAFNVISSLIMMVKDKTRDIAVLRTLGAGRGAVMRIFLMCGASVGVTGTFVGTVLGIVFCLNIERLRQWLQSITGTDLFNPEVYYLEHLPAKLDWGEVSQVILMALALSLLATLYPSWRAARTDPVEALRNE